MHYKSNTFSYAVRLRTMIEAVIYDVMQYYNIDTFPSYRYSPEVSKAIKYISKNLNASLRVSDISTYLFISNSKLSKLFKKEMGISVHNFGFV